MIRGAVGFIETILNNSAAVIGFLSGALGGTASNLTTKYIWSSHESPELRLKESVREITKTDGNGNVEEVLYEVEVENSGKSSASNCRVNIHFRGMITDGEEAGNEVEIETMLCWKSRGSDSMTINRGDSSYVEILRWNRTNGNGFEFPVNVQESKSASISFRSKMGLSGRSIDTDDANRIHRDTFKNIDWEVREIKITGESTAPERGTVKFGWEKDNFNLSVQRDTSSYRQKVPSLLRS